MEKIQRQQITEALVEVALLESKEVSVRIAEIIAYLQQREHLAALGALQALDEPFKLIGVTLLAAAPLSQQST